MKIKVELLNGNEHRSNPNCPSVSHIFDGETAVKDHIKVLCTHFKIPIEKANCYALQNPISQQYIEDAFLTPEKLVEAEKSYFVLRMKPYAIADRVIESLKNNPPTSPVIKDIIFNIRFQLKDVEYVEEFIAKGGINQLLDAITKSYGNTQSYALTALRCFMGYNSGLDEVMSRPQLIDKLYSLVSSTVLVSVCRQAIELLFVVCNFDGFHLVHRAAKNYSLESNTTPYSNLISLLSSGDMETQLNTLTLFNCLLDNAPNPRKAEKLLSRWKSLGISKILKSQEHVTHSDFKTQLARFQTNSGIGLDGGRKRSLTREMSIQELELQLSQYREQQPLISLLCSELKFLRNAIKSAIENGSYINYRAPTERYDEYISRKNEIIGEGPINLSYIKRSDKFTSAFRKSMYVRSPNTSVLFDQSTLLEEDIDGGSEIGKSPSVKFSRHQPDDCSNNLSPISSEKSNNSGTLLNTSKLQKVKFSSLSLTSKGESNNKTMGIEQAVTCCVCLEIFDEQQNSPQLLIPCADTICLKCVLKSNDNGKLKQFKCSYCSQDVSSYKQNLQSILFLNYYKDQKQHNKKQQQMVNYMEGSTLNQPVIITTTTTTSTTINGNSLNDFTPQQQTQPNIFTQDSSNFIPTLPSKSKCQPVKSVISPQKRMKPLHWNRILNSQHPNKKTIWSILPEVTFDEDQFVDLFSLYTEKLVSFNGSPVIGSIAGHKVKPIQKVISVLSQKRSNSIQIMCSKLPSDESLIRSIRELDSNKLTLEHVSSLLQNLPTLEEMASIQELHSADVILDKPERWCLMIDGFPKIKPRLRCWEFMLKFNDQIKGITESTFTVSLACQEILNSSSLSGQSDGFNLDALGKIVEIRDNNNNGSLLDFAIKTLVTHYPKNCNIPNELTHIPNASLINLFEIGEKLQKLSKEYTELLSLVDEITTSTDSEDPFTTIVPKFMSNTFTTLKTSQKEYMETEKLYQETVEFFCPINVNDSVNTLQTSRFTSEKFFTIFSTIITSFKKSPSKRLSQKGFGLKIGNSDDPMLAIIEALKTGSPNDMVPKRWPPA
eukprot:gene3261-4084_t